MMTQGAELQSDAEDQVVVAQKRFSGTVTGVVMLSRVLELNEILDEGQKLLTPAARAGLLDWSVEYEPVITTAKFEEETRFGQTLAVISKTAPSTETIEQYRVCLDAALANIGAADQ